MTNRLNVDLKKLANSQVLAPLAKQLNGYEKRAKELVREFDLRSRDARTRSRARLEEFLGHLRKTRTGVEKRVRSIIEEESKRLNVKVTDLISSLKDMAIKEAKASKAKTKSAKGTGKRKSSGTRKTRKKSTSGEGSHASAP